MSNETAHTPGPWTRMPDERFRHDNSAGVRAACGIYIAAALDRNRYDLDDEVEANARLIAAAPELLAACEEALAEARERDEDLGYGCWPQVRAAIAKARGEVTE